MSQKLSFAASMDSTLYEQQMQNRNAIASTTLTSATRPTMHQFENELQQRLHHYQHQQHALDVRFQSNRLNFSNYSNAYPYNIPYGTGTFGQHARTNSLRASSYDYETYINRARYSSYQHQMVPSSVLHYPPRSYPFQQHQLLQRQHTNIYQSQSPYYMQQYQQQQSHHSHQQQLLAAQRSPYLEMHLNGQASLGATNPSIYSDSANLTLQQLEQQRQLQQQLHYQQMPIETQNFLSPTQRRDAFPTNETTSLFFQQQHKSYPSAQDALQVSNQRNASNPSESVHINPAEYSHNLKNDLGQVSTPLNNIARIAEEEANAEESGRAQLVISPPMLSATGTDSGVSSCSGSSSSNYQCVDDKDFICLTKENSQQYESASSDRESKKCNGNIEIKSEKMEELQTSIKTEVVANAITEADIKDDIGNEFGMVKVKKEENLNDEVEQLDTFKPKLESKESTGSISIDTVEAAISTNSSPTTDRALTPCQHISTHYGSKPQISTNRQFDDNSWSPFPTSPNNTVQNYNSKSTASSRNLTPSPIPIVPQNSPVDYSMQSVKKKHILEYDLIPSRKKTKRKLKSGNEKDSHEELRNTKPLPGFQQTFGATEIGRFSETFLLNADNATNFLGDIEHQAEFYSEYAQHLSAYENVDNRNINNETHFDNFPCTNAYNMTPYERYMRTNKRLNEIHCNDNGY